MSKTNATDLQMFTPAGDKLMLGTVDGPALLEIAAQYNPKELAHVAAAQWAPTNGHGKKPTTPSGSSQALSWSGTDPQTLTCDLLFDGAEEGVSILPFIQTLISFTEPVDMKSTSAFDRRPPLCVAIWGKQKPFRCVVTGVSTKITMFGLYGMPLRAVCTVTLKEADILSMWKSDDNNTDHAADVQKREFEIGSDSRGLPMPE